MLIEIFDADKKYLIKCEAHEGILMLKCKWNLFYNIKVPKKLILLLQNSNYWKKNQKKMNTSQLSEKDF